MTFKRTAMLLSQRPRKGSVVATLDQSGWAKRPEGTVKEFDNAVEREVICIFLGDTVRFEFDDGGLSRVRISTRYHPGSAQGTWDHLKRRVSQQLRQPGVPADLSGLGIRECEWTFGVTVIRAKLFERGRASKAYVYLERRHIRAETETTSLEDLFIYEAA